MNYPFAEKYDDSQYILLNSNINPFGPSPLALKAINENLRKINLYPSRDEHLELKKQLVIKLREEKINTTPKNIVLGNGSDEVIEFVVKLAILKFKKPKVIVGEKTFAFYEYCARTYGLDVLKVKLKEYSYDINQILDVASKNQPCIIMLCNPINPTGKIITKKELEYLIDNLPDDTFLLSDEAYFEFAFHLNNKDWRSDDYRSVLHISSKPNIFVSRTFSKAYGLAGIRLGYLISDFSEEIEHTISPPFNVNYLALKAGIYALKDRDFVQKTLENNLMGMRILESIEESVPSWANFALIKLKKNTTYNELKQKGILTRDMSSYGFDNLIRVSVGKIEDMELFQKIFRKIENQ
ncbi:MAG: histidinol-phosphate transaminase [Candidatus Calescibacterium sp.]|nr:histidinol-phosphate transaminase [Candidatus Calescibacterium sp.]